MSVVLNGNTYASSDFVGSSGRGYSETFAATGLQLFPESIFTDLVAELASAASVGGVSPGAAGGILVSSGSAWIRAASATITSAGAASFGSTLGVTGNLSVNTSKFVVTAATGALALTAAIEQTVASGAYSYLGLDQTSVVKWSVQNVATTGLFTITEAGVQNWLTIAKTSGATSLLGTLAVTGTSTLTGNVGIGEAAGTSALAVKEATANTIATITEHTHATLPYGHQISFSGGAPNNATNWFIQCMDTSATRFQVFSNGNTTVGGTLGVTGTITGSVVTAASRFEVNANASFPGAVTDRARMYYSSSSGLILYGAGSSNDLTILNKSGSGVITIPTGTTGVNLAGTLSVTSTIEGASIKVTNTNVVGWKTWGGFESTADGTVTLLNNARTSGGALTTGTLSVTGTSTLTGAVGIANAVVGGYSLVVGGTANIRIINGTGIDHDISGAQSDGTLDFNCDANNEASAPNFQFRISGSEKVRITDGGLVGINEATNANQTIGLTINQGAADNEILALKSSDVAHGMTTLAETDTYLSFSKASPSSGGVQMVGYSAGTAGVLIEGKGVADNVLKSTTAIGYILLSAFKKSGTTVGDVGANGNLLVIRNNATARFIFDAEGSAHADVEWTTF